MDVRRHSVQCQECYRCYSPAHLISGFNHIAGTITGGAGVSEMQLTITLQPDAPELTHPSNAQEAMSVFESSLHGHQQLIIANNLQPLITIAITPELVSSLLLTTPDNTITITALEHLRRAIVLATLLALHDHPELANDQNALGLEVMVLATSIYSSFQHQHEGGSNYLLSHGFNTVEQNYHSLFYQLEHQIVSPPPLINIQPGSSVVAALHAVLDDQQTNYHFFTHPGLGIAALLRIGENWTLILNTGVTITAPKEKLITMLVMAQWQFMDYMPDVGMVVLAAAIGGVTGMIINAATGGQNAASYIWAALLGGVAGGAIAGAGAVSSHYYGIERKDPKRQDQPRRKKKDDDQSDN